MGKMLVKSMEQTLQIQEYESIFSGFQFWNMNDFIKQINANKNKGGVLAFVRGLRLSAQLIYSIRGVLSERPDLDVNWGHILDDNNTFCSRECDIIIHKKGEIQKWNGRHGCVMDFRFIRKSNAIAIVSCKSYVTSNVINSEKQYCKEMKAFVKKVWMFGECCSPTSVDTLKATAVNVGFDKFWCAYTFNKRTSEIDPLHADWLDFIEEIKSI